MIFHYYISYYYYLSLFNFIKYIKKHLGWIAGTRSRLRRKHINHLKCHQTIFLCGREWRGTKASWWEIEKKEWKSDFKQAQHSKSKIIASTAYHPALQWWGNSHLFRGLKSLQIVTAALESPAASLGKNWNQPEWYIPKQRHFFYPGPQSWLLVFHAVSWM